MARPIEYDPQAVLDRAIEVFWRKGYTATSIEDLVDATGVKRGSLYQAFGNKAALFEAAIDRYLETGAIQRLTDETDDRPLREVLRALFEDLVAFGANDPRRRGCLLTNSAVELATADSRIAEKIAGNLRTLEDVLTARLLAARRAGEIGSGRNPRALARFIVSSIQGIRVMSRIRPEAETLRDIAETVLDALE